MKISAVTLGARDLERSLQFLEAVFGWPHSFDSAGVAYVEGAVTGGTSLALYPLEPLRSYVGFAAEEPSGTRALAPATVTLSVNVDSRETVKRIAGRALAAGAAELRAPGEVDWGGFISCFLDLDGNPWEIVWNPGYTP